MKNIFRLASLLLYFLCFILFAVIGMSYASLTGAAEGQGLAGGAIILFDGIVIGIIAILISAVLTRNTETPKIIRANKILTVLVLVLWAVFYLKFRSDKDQEATEVNRNPKPVAEGAVGWHHYKERTSPVNQDMGYGFFKPDFINHPAIGFFGPPETNSNFQNQVAYDSIAFSINQYGNYEISYAPPWLKPEYLKMDYEILYFRIITLGRNCVEVITNDVTQRTAWMSREDGEVIPWAEFLLNVSSIEIASGRNAKIYTKPQTTSAAVNLEFEMVSPVLVKDDWVKVSLVDDNYETVGEGWIEWRKAGELLITINILS